MQKEIGLGGFLRQDALRDGVLDASLFLTDNSHQIALLYPMLSPAEVYIGFYDDSAAEELLVGTAARPLETDFGLPIPAKRMVLLYNGARLGNLAKHEPDIGITMLWRQIFKAVRLWFLRHDQVPGHMLIPQSALVDAGCAGLAEAIESHAALVKWSAHRTAEEFDAVAVARYLADLMHERYMDGRRVMLGEIYAALFLANGFTHSEHMPQR